MSLVHTCIRITDIDRSIAFYGALGFQERRRNSNGTISEHILLGLPVDGDEPRLELMYEHARAASDTPQTGYGHIAVVTPDLDVSLTELAAVGVAPEGEPSYWPQAGTRVCFVRDPDGYPIELIQRGVQPPEG